MIKKIEATLDKYGIDTIFVYPVLFFFVWYLFFKYLPAEAVEAIRMFFTLAFLWLPVILLYIFWDQWIKYVRALFILSQEYTVIEFRLPQEIAKSPAAMELFLVSLHQTGGETTFIDRWWLGKTRVFWSLELVSIEGEVHFYMWLRKAFKDFIEARLYAQYPEVEVHEVPDYTRRIVYDEKTMMLYGTEYKFAKPDPYPIKTYVDFGLDKDPKEEYKIDPIGHLVEYLGSMGPQEYLWIQFILRAHKQNEWLGIFGKDDDLAIAAKEEVKKIKEHATVSVGEGDDESSRVLLTDPDKHKIEAIENAVGKLSFDVGIRALYFAKKENFKGVNTAPGLNSLMRHVSSNDLNGILSTRGMNRFDYFWQDPFGVRKPAHRKWLFELFQQRAYFFGPFYRQHPIVLNVEEMATLYHFPGDVLKAPGLTRIPSRKAGPPPNLPI